MGFGAVFAACEFVPTLAVVDGSATVGEPLVAVPDILIPPVAIRPEFNTVMAFRFKLAVTGADVDCELEAGVVTVVP